MNHRPLQRALVTNAVFSATTGLGALLFAETLADALGPPAWSLRVLGAGLAAFAVVAALESRARRRTGTIQIIAADLAWVVGATALIVVPPSWLTPTGRTVLAAVTAVVAGVAATQWISLRIEERA